MHLPYSPRRAQMGCSHNACLASPGVAGCPGLRTIPGLPLQCELGSDLGRIWYVQGGQGNFFSVVKEETSPAESQHIFFCSEPPFYLHYITRPMHGNPAPHVAGDVSSPGLLLNVATIISFKRYSKFRSLRNCQIDDKPIDCASVHYDILGRWIRCRCVQQTDITISF